MDQKQKKAIILINTLLVAIIFGFVTFNQLKVGDFQPHIEWARKLGESSYLFLRANILFQRLVLVVRDLLPFNFLARISQLLKQIIDIKSYDISAFIVTIIAYLGTFFLSFRFIAQNVSWPKPKSKYLLISIATYIVMLVGPIFLFSFPTRQYLGYINGNPFHNPTYILMKPFALGFFLMVISFLFKKTSWINIIFAGLLLFLATLSKPNFTISFVPTIFIVAVLLKFSRIRELNFKFLLFSVLLTSLIVLISQYIMMYTGNRGDRILLSPFEAIKQFVPDVSVVLLSTIFSILFSIFAVVFYWAKIKQNLAFQLASINFVLSLGLALLFTEQTDMLSLNFWWTPMMAVYLLFLVTICSFIDEVINEISQKQRFTIKNYVLSGLLLIHLICGIIFYVSSLGPVSPVV